MVDEDKQGARARPKFNREDPAFLEIAEAFVSAIQECDRIYDEICGLPSDADRRQLLVDLHMAEQDVELVREDLFELSRQFMFGAAWTAFAGDDVHDLTPMSDDGLIASVTSDEEENEVSKTVKPPRKSVAKSVKVEKKWWKGRHPGAQVCISVTPGLYEALDVVREKLPGRGPKGELTRAGAIELALVPWLKSQAAKVQKGREVESWLQKMRDRRVKADEPSKAAKSETRKGSAKRAVSGKKVKAKKVAKAKTAKPKKAPKVKKPASKKAKPVEAVKAAEATASQLE